MGGDPVAWPTQPCEIRARFQELHERASHVYLHVDGDVLDASAWVANGYAVAGGPQEWQVARAIDDCRRQFELVGATVSGYDPQHDVSRSVLKAAIEFVKGVVA